MLPVRPLGGTRVTCARYKIHARSRVCIRVPEQYQEYLCGSGKPQVRLRRLVSTSIVAGRLAFRTLYLLVRGTLSHSPCCPNFLVPIIHVGTPFPSLRRQAGRQARMLECRCHIFLFHFFFYSLLSPGIQNSIHSLSLGSE